MIDDIADYISYRIRAISGFEMVSFNEEVKHLESYARLEQARFSYVHTEYSLEDTDFALPSMSVIFLAGNAIHHGITRGHGKGILQVKSYFNSGFHCIEVCDDGVGVAFEGKYPQSKNNGIGNLVALAKRIECMAGGSLEISSKPGKGTRAVVRIP